jgi:hypothetical protein
MFVTQLGRYAHVHATQRYNVQRVPVQRPAAKLAVSDFKLSVSRSAALSRPFAGGKKEKRTGERRRT